VILFRQPLQRPNRLGQHKLQQGQILFILSNCSSKLCHTSVLQVCREIVLAKTFLTYPLPTTRELLETFKQSSELLSCINHVALLYHQTMHHTASIRAHHNISFVHLACMHQTMHHIVSIIAYLNIHHVSCILHHSAHGDNMTPAKKRWISRPFLVIRRWHSLRRLYTPSSRFHYVGFLFL
jgi:hypothetical protein